MHMNMKQRKYMDKNKKKSDKYEGKITNYMESWPPWLMILQIHEEGNTKLTPENSFTPFTYIYIYD